MSDYDPLNEPEDYERTGAGPVYAQVWDDADGWHYIVKDATDVSDHKTKARSRTSYKSEESARKAAAKGRPGILVERIGAP